MQSIRKATNSLFTAKMSNNHNTTHSTQSAPAINGKSTIASDQSHAKKVSVEELTMKTNSISINAATPAKITNNASVTKVDENAVYIPRRILYRPSAIRIPMVRVHDARMQEIELLNQPVRIQSSRRSAAN